MKKKFKVGDLVHLNPKSEWNDGDNFNPIRTLGEVIDTNWLPEIGFPIRVRWGREGFNSYGDKDLLPAPDSLILEYLDESLEEELKKLGIKS